LTPLQLAPRALTVLGIETSCDETAAAVVRLSRDGTTAVLSSVVASQIAAHAPYGGVVPEIAARAHVEVIDTVLAKAMEDAGISFDALDGVAATAGPGLIGGVMVGLSAGKAIALARGLPLMAVNHLEGHALSARLTEDAPFPFLLLLVSGGHCQLLSVEGVGRYRRLGTTIDDAAGEAFDKIAASLGLGYPGGPALEALAMGGDATRFTLPRALLGREGCDFSFSGLKTAAARLGETVRSDADRSDLAAAVQAAIARQLAERSEKAMRLHRETHAGAARLLVVAGGVAANGAVRARLQASAAAQGFAFIAPALRYCTDNAAMIALAGAERLAVGLIDDIDVPARPRWPLDEASARDRPIHAAGRKGAKA
jgi:N6-L-threonylcarbamoyladenine synthase